MTYAVIFEKWEGKTILNLHSVVDAIYDAYVPIAATDDRRERIPNLYPMQSEHSSVAPLASFQRNQLAELEKPRG